MADAQANQDQTNDEFDNLLTAIDTETNRLADEVKALADRLPASGTLDAKQTASLKARLSEHADRLRAIAADAENPVPTGPVTPAAPPAPAPPPADQTAGTQPAAGTAPAGTPGTPGTPTQPTSGTPAGDGTGGA
jgi:uncharacterized coiled-coil protein SlyX